MKYFDEINAAVTVSDREGVGDAALCTINL